MRFYYEKKQESELKKILLNNPDALSDTREIISLLAVFLPANSLKHIQNYVECVNLGIVKEMLATEKYNGEDLDYYAEKLFYNSEKRIEADYSLVIICGWLKMLGIKRVKDSFGVRYSILSKNVDELNLNHKIKRYFEENKVKTIKDIFKLNYKKLYEDKDSYYYKDIAPMVFELIDDIEKMDMELYTEDKHPGKNRCELLKKIRKEIADANGIKFEPIECHHAGPCMGTCPACDKEIEYLDKKIRKMKENGIKVNLEGLVDKEIIMSGCDVDPRIYFELGESGSDFTPKEIRKRTEYGGILFEDRINY
jgi:hypothetical protein